LWRPGVLQPRVARIREPLAGEARIRQLAVGVNFIDIYCRIYCRRGAFDLVPPGGVLGMEAAGVVEAIGPEVRGVRPGDRVAYACAPSGAYVSMRTMRADLLVRLPEALGEAEAAALLLKASRRVFCWTMSRPSDRGRSSSFMRPPAASAKFSAGGPRR
jgi:NADPH2:quinone reductase